MPIYRYRCEECAEITEVWVKMDDPPTEICKACGAKALVKMVARTGFHLKGGGWYASGYESNRRRVD